MKSSISSVRPSYWASLRKKKTYASQNTSLVTQDSQPKRKTKNFTSRDQIDISAKMQRFQGEYHPSEPDIPPAYPTEGDYPLSTDAD